MNESGGDWTPEKGPIVVTAGDIIIPLDPFTVSLEVGDVRFVCGPGVRPAYQTPSGGVAGALTWAAGNVVTNGVAPSLVS